ncbi:MULTISPECIES: hypothetical protein [unclassified Streptomyces]|nr:MULTISPECIES: hypothetical protein [unclassified Streptomyces]MED7951886.1 hypothetical protein [Streptomyces sp. BE303]MEE1824637.1 hypothetical protein [Streptomyces sp. BE20]
MLGISSSSLDPAAPVVPGPPVDIGIDHGGRRHLHHHREAEM